MGKRRSGQRKPAANGDSQPPKTQKRFYVNPDDLSDDEVDQFHASRDKILLDDDKDIHGKINQSEEDDDEEEDEEVLAMNLSDESDNDSDDEEKYFDDEEDEDEDEEDEDDEEDVKKFIKQMPGLRRHVSAFEEEEEEGETEDDSQPGEVEGEEDLAWGNRKNVYYDDDAEFDEEAAKEEEEEAMRLRRERVKSMADDDFLDEFKATSTTTQSALISLQPDADNDQRMVREFNDELDQIKLPLPNNPTGMAAAVTTITATVIEKDLSGMSKQELLQHLTNESPEFLGLVAEFQSRVNELKTSIQPLLERLRGGQSPTAQGVSLLELKNQLVLTYCLNMAYYFYLKADGGRVSDHPVIEKLVQLRLYLEKLKPIEQKLKYQIDKLVKSAITASSSTTAHDDDDEGTVAEKQSKDALQFRANPGNLSTANDADGSELESAVESGKNDGVYRPPKIAPVHFDETVGMSAAEKNRRQLDRLRKQASSSRMMQDMMAEVGDVPEEILDAGNMLSHNARRDEEWEERIRAEEEMMVRLPVSRKDKKKIREQKRFTNELDNLEDFGDYEFVEQLDRLNTETATTTTTTTTKKNDDSSGGGKMKQQAKLATNLRELINSRLPESDAVNRKRKQGGDDDVPRRQRQSLQSSSHGGNDYDASEDYNNHLDSNSSKRREEQSEEEEEDEFYQEIKESKRSRKEQRAAAYQQQTHQEFADNFGGADADEVVGGKRMASFDILKNKGLTPHRKKEQRNPRVKRRVQYEQKMIKLKSFKPAMRTQEKRYEGESTGIKKNLARSVRF